MVRLQDAVLVRSEFLQFSFEDLVVLIRDGFFVQDEHVRYVVVVDL
jgi:hypothetical protein